MVIVAHRGDPRHAPENTLASLVMAWRHGRRWMEMDIRGTRDGIPILFHDATLSRVAGRRGRVARQPWARLQSLDVGRWFHPRFAGERIATLADVLSAFRHRPVTFFLDLKVRGIEPRVHAAIRDAGMMSCCRIACNHASAIARFRALHPRLPLYRVTGYHERVTPRLIAHARRLNLTGLLVYQRWVTPAALARTRAAGLEIYAWTIRQHREEIRCRQLGVTGIMSERCPR